jgi:hypothetical protein
MIDVSLVLADLTFKGGQTAEHPFAFVHSRWCVVSPLTSSRPTSASPFHPKRLEHRGRLPNERASAPRQLASRSALESVNRQAVRIMRLLGIKSWLVVRPRATPGESDESFWKC